MKNNIFRLALLIMPLAFSQAQTIDHNCIDLHSIPSNWIDSAKAKLNIGYGHTSHGSQIVSGMNAIEAYYTDGTYNWSHSGGENELHLFEGSSYSEGDLDHDVGYSGWDDETREYLNSFPDCNVIIWSWCGQVNGVDLQTHYFEPMALLETEYSNVKFVYMTGHLEGLGNDGSLKEANDQIRNYCQTNDKILFDFADIEKYDPDGTTNYQEYFANDECLYDPDGESPINRTQNWATNWLANNPDHELAQVSNSCSSCSHSVSLNCVKKGIAAWHLWARLAGWQKTISTATDIVQFEFPQQTGSAIINTESHTVSIEVEYGANPNNLIPTIFISSGATIDPASGMVQDFSETVTYTVTAEDGTTQQAWMVTVDVSESAENNILSFTLPEQAEAATINTENHSINLTVIPLTNLSNLTPVITISYGATISPASDVTQDFSSPITYTVTAQDGTQQIWTVTITEAGQNNAPVIDVAFDAIQYKGFVYSLDASNCYDSDGDELSFSWNVPDEFCASALSGSVISVLPTENATETVYSIDLNVSDGMTISQKSLSIHVKSFKPDIQKLQIASVTASDNDEGNLPENILDNNFETRWSAEGDNQWLVMELVDSAFISHFEIAFYKGETRSTYFDIYASSDNAIWDLLVDNEASCGFSQNIHVFEIPQEYSANSYKFIKLVGHMNSENSWNSYTEFRIYGSLIDNQVSGLAQSSKTNESLKIHPNPTNGIIHLNTNKLIKLAVYDYSGKKVLESEKQDLDISGYSKGIYVLKAYLSDGWVIVEKIILK